VFPFVTLQGSSPGVTVRQNTFGEVDVCMYVHIHVTNFTHMHSVDEIYLDHDNEVVLYLLL
jgi:hypothetical protein